MCVNPVIVRNPYWSNPAYVYNRGKVESLDRRFVPTTPEIEVPCGKCEECRNTYFNALLQRVQMETLTSYAYMVTLTYDNDHIPSFKLNEYIRPTRACHHPTPGVQEIYYADFTDIQLMFKRLRKEQFFQDREFRYIHATEYGTMRFRPHHHLIIFLAKKQNDTDVTPLLLEAQLSSLIRKHYVRNVGSLKFPKYEPLFTYAERYRNGRLEANFQCELIRNKNRVDSLDGICDINSISASISYVLSYVNKPSRYDDLIQPFVDRLEQLSHYTDYRRIKSILQSRVRYSKNLGFGFADGKKVRPSLATFTVSQERKELIDFVQSLPLSFDEFVECYPDLAAEYDSFLTLSYDILFDYVNVSLYDPSIEGFVNEYLSPSFKLCWYLMLKYDRSHIYRLCSSAHLNTSSWSPSLCPMTPYDSSFESSVTFKTLRKFIDQGAANHTPFIAFQFELNGNVCYMPLCKYFKRYVSDYKDVQRMYDYLGCKDFDSYCQLFNADAERARKLREKQRISAINLDQNRAEEDVFLTNKAILEDKVSKLFFFKIDDFLRI